MTSTKKPLFSIITASYNYENYIKETIESVLSQTFSDWEMVIIDDGSKDNSIEVINSYVKNDDRIKLFCHENNQNKGLIETIKLAVDKAQGEWIVFLESDDTIQNDYLKKKLEVIEKHPEVEFIFNDVQLIGAENRFKEYDNYFKTTSEIFSKNPYPKNLFKYFKKTNLISTFSVVALKKSLFKNIDFNCPIPTIIDHYLWIQMAKKTKLYYLDEKLTNWRLHEKSYITRFKKTNKQAALFDYKKNVLFLKPYQKPLIPFLYLGYLFALFRKSFIKLHLKDREICIFEKWYKF